ncbi:MAG: hypothetical protein M3O34_08945 [Chloroflexota bacterium]|nr:hypothetical protein [Chloroflexota bacterium]
MADTGFPRDDYTPHGLLANPYAVARSWQEGSGGVLRSSREGVGLGWVYPWALGAEAGAELRVDIRYGGRQLFDAAGSDRVRATHHSARLLELAWEGFGYDWTARLVLVTRDELGLEIAAERRSNPEEAGQGRTDDVDRPIQVEVALHGWRRAPEDGAPVATVAAGVGHDGTSASPEGLAGWIDLGAPYGVHRLYLDAPSDGPNAMQSDVGAEPEAVAAGAPTRDVAHVTAAVPLDRAHEAGVVVGAILHHASSGEARLASARDLDDHVSEAVARAWAADDAIWSGGARLEGDWPAAWRRGWVYDLETTRMCVFPAGGVFRDVWPSWMVQWPRAVVAEGTLDMVRLAYLSPDLATRAVLALFRDAPASNVPCIFQHGEPNMVAKDGSVCGTSPAWCVPFYNLERLYLLTLDDAWLTELYPYLARYVDWWLTERTDRDGWAVYKCTWEAGEDDTPRLDPERRGDNVVSELVRPVELQAALVLSASVLARFAAVLGRDDEAARWRCVAEAYAEKTRALWDPAAGRFRDWDVRTGRFLEPSGAADYGGIDPCRFSALAFTPVLAGLADLEQVAALAREVELYDRPPWTLWASWSYVVLESALAAGWRAFATRVASGIVGRVYDELDRRTVAGNEPTPGVAREYWPLDLSEWRACEGYGWGATTASFLARQVFGFLEGGYPAPPATAALDVTPIGEDGRGPAAGAPTGIPGEITGGTRREGPLTFRLAPGLPPEFLKEGRRYAIVNMPYRGTHVSVEYVVRRGGPDEPGGAPLSALVTMPVPVMCRVLDAGGEVTYAGWTVLHSHRFEVRNGSTYLIELTFR